MGVYTFEGPMGHGKTAGAVNLCYKEHIQNGKSIISNTPLAFDYTKFDLKYFVENFNGEDSKLDNCVILLDEAYQYFNNRSSQSKINILFSMFVVQCRKRGVDMFLCVHNLNDIDIKMRRAVDIRGMATFNKEKPCRKCKGEKFLKSRLCHTCEGKGFEVKEVVCTTCRGYKYVPEYTKSPCLYCRGKGCALCGYLGYYFFMTGNYSICGTCKGYGITERKKVECSDCKGLGHIGEAQECDRCLGFGETGVGRVYFCRVRSRDRANRTFFMEFFGPEIWKLYDTNKRIPLQQKMFQGLDVAEIV